MLVNIACIVCCCALLTYANNKTAHQPTIASKTTITNPTSDSQHSQTSPLLDGKTHNTTRLPLPFVGHVTITLNHSPTVNRQSTNTKPSTTPSLLNSESIRRKFGNYGVELIPYDKPRIRISSLYSLENKKKTTRTLAIVTYPPTINPAFWKEHEIIQRGASIGETLKRYGWAIEKKSTLLGTIKSDKNLDTIYKMMNTAPATLAIHSYELTISKNNKSYRYATLVEIHHPEHLSIDDLKAMHEQ